MDKLIIDNKTAWQCWMGQTDRSRLMELSSAPESRAMVAPSKAPSTSIVNEAVARKLVPDCGIVYALTSKPEGRMLTSRVVTHRCDMRLPAGAFRALGGGLYIASPELLFIETAKKETSLSHAVRSADLLCSKYRIDPESPTGLCEVEPVTTVEKLLSFAGKYYKGNRNLAHRALRHAANGAASPTEIALHLLACLPLSQGGKGMPRPRLNYRIELTEHEQKILSRRYCVCDLAWPKANVALEYNSRSVHSETYQWEDDALRASVLANAGVNVIPVTWPQLSNIDAFDMVITEAAAAMGKRIRIRNADQHRSAELALRAMLFPGIDPR